MYKNWSLKIQWPKGIYWLYKWYAVCLLKYWRVNPSKQCNVLIVFDDIIVDIISNKKLSQIVTELFIRGRKLIISLVFISQTYFALRKYFRLDSAHYLIMKIPNKWELKQVAFDHLSDTDFRDFINLYKKCTAKSFSSLIIDCVFESGNSLIFRYDFLERI